MNLILQAIKSLFRKIDNKIDDIMKKVIPIPNSAKVGQYLFVKAVDKDGRPTEWDTKLPDTVHPNWHEFDAESKSYIINNPLRMDSDTEFKNIFGNGDYNNKINFSSVLQCNNDNYIALIFDFNLFGYLFTECRMAIGTNATGYGPIGVLKTYPIPHFGNTALLNVIGIDVDVDYSGDEEDYFCFCKYDGNKICAILPLDSFNPTTQSPYIYSIDIKSKIKIDPSYIPGYELDEDYELVAEIPSCDFYAYYDNSVVYRYNSESGDINYLESAHFTSGDNIMVIIDNTIYKAVFYSDYVCGNGDLYGDGYRKTNEDIYMNISNSSVAIALRRYSELIGANVKIYKSRTGIKYSISPDYLPGYNEMYENQIILDSDVLFDHYSLYPYNGFEAYINIGMDLFNISDSVKIEFNNNEYINRFTTKYYDRIIAVNEQDGIDITYYPKSGNIDIHVISDVIVEPITTRLKIYKLTNKHYKLDPNFLPNSNPLVLYAVRDNTYPQLYLNDSSYGDQALKAIMEGRQILIRTPNKDIVENASAALNNYNSALFSPVLTYHIPNYENDYLYLYYLRDEKNTLDLSAAGAGIVEIPIYGQLKLKLSKQYMECPIEHKTPEEYNIIINEAEASTVEELPDTTEEEEQT